MILKEEIKTNTNINNIVHLGTRDNGNNLLNYLPLDNKEIGLIHIDNEKRSDTVFRSEAGFFTLHNTSYMNSYEIHKQFKPIHWLNYDKDSKTYIIEDYDENRLKDVSEVEDYDIDYEDNINNIKNNIMEFENGIVENESLNQVIYYLTDNTPHEIVLNVNESIIADSKMNLINLKYLIKEISSIKNINHIFITSSEEFFKDLTNCLIHL